MLKKILLIGLLAIGTSAAADYESVDQVASCPASFEVKKHQCQKPEGLKALWFEFQTDYDQLRDAVIPFDDMVQQHFWLLRQWRACSQELCEAVCHSEISQHNASYERCEKKRQEFFSAWQVNTQQQILFNAQSRFIQAENQFSNELVDRWAELINRGQKMLNQAVRRFYAQIFQFHKNPLQ